MHFSTQRKIRFGDTDPAGIVFYPRYFEMFVEVIEDFCAEVLGTDFARLHLELDLAIPLVRAEVDFLAPSRLGEMVTFGLTLTSFGRTSFSAEIMLSLAGQTRLRAKLVMVFMTISQGRPTPPPPQIAARLRALLPADPPESPAP